ncbi:unnamed protein product [Lasius platythorax]|uniref:Uncharacterized protein n=1 Tax=Lasius platythorax TaxID=488582 RepID=A0AAV2MWC7_9HYME
MEEYCIVEFEDGPQMIPSSWLTESKTAARWSQFTSHSRFMKAVQKHIPCDNSCLLYDVKRILATAKTYEKGLVKLKRAEFVSDINSESDDYEDLKKSRKDRAKRIRSSSDDSATDNEGVQLPSFPMIPQPKTYSKKINKYNERQKQQLTENISTNLHKEKDLEISSMNSDSSNKMKEIYRDSVADNNKEITDKNENILSNGKSFDKFFKNGNDASSSSSDFQRYIIRKLTDIGFKISSIDKQQKLFNSRLNIILQRIETINSNEKIQENESNEHVMDNFPIDTIEDLEQFEKFLSEGIINHKELIKELSRIGGNDVKGVTFNLLRKLMTDYIIRLVLDDNM